LRVIGPGTTIERRVPEREWLGWRRAPSGVKHAYRVDFDQMQVFGTTLSREAQLDGTISRHMAAWVLFAVARA
jgi:hypothetical protein